ncbi:hypothetical protein ACW2QC_19010 [Virgibacillus sp. FSP13]
MKNNSLIAFFINLIIGVIIIVAPVIITGRFYNENEVMGSLLVSEFVMRTTALIIGLLVIYDSIKRYFK